MADKVQLPDGRYIAYEERGVSREVAKRNILVSHGFLSCRLAGDSPSLQSLLSSLWLSFQENCIRTHFAGHLSICETFVYLGVVL